MRRFPLETIDVAPMIDCERTGSEASSSAGVIDNQSVKAPAAQGAGLRRRRENQRAQAPHCNDADGWLLIVNLTTADVSNSAGAQYILDAFRKRWRGSNMSSPMGAPMIAENSWTTFEEFVIEIVRRIDADPGFKVLPRRWVVARTFGWVTGWRGHRASFRKRIDVSKAMIRVTMGGLILRRIAH